MFSNIESDKIDEKVEETINIIKDKYRKNSILRAISYDNNATQISRNNLI